jgi:hypothetical protein
VKAGHGTRGIRILTLKHAMFIISASIPRGRLSGSTNTCMVAASEFAAFVGIDWADAKHDICLQAAGSEHREFSVLAHRKDAIEQWARSLRARFAGPIAVCLELAKKPLVWALQRYDFLVLFPINPNTLAKYREAFALSHAKDDPTDAECALDLLLRYRDRLQALASRQCVATHARRVGGTTARAGPRSSRQSLRAAPPWCASFMIITRARAR